MNRRSTVVLLSLCVILVFAGVAAAAQGGKNAPGTIVGQVQVDCGTNAAGTLVYIPGHSWVVITGAPGDFVLSSVPPGTYPLHVEGGTPPSSIELPAVIIAPGETTDVGTVSLGADLDADPNNCGTCGNVCPANANETATCSAGTCQATCNAGFADCNGTPADGCEVNLQTNVNNCGSCGNACASGQTCIAGVCSSAGVCTPGATETCIAGVGACAPGTRTCDSGGNWGACSSITGPTPEVCDGVDNDCDGVVDNNCTCPAGFANCDGNGANGCEVYLQTNVNNCGSCGNACASGQTCIAGVCQ